MPIELKDLNPTQVKTIFSKVSVGELDECWPVDCYKNRDGYPLLSGKVDGEVVTIFPYRLTYEVHNSSIDSELEIDHLCNTRDCCNPLHLEEVTRAENNRRMWAEREPVTHCKYDHEFTEKNTYVTPDGRRQCRICIRRRQREYQQRQQEK